MEATNITEFSGLEVTTIPNSIHPPPDLLSPPDPQPLPSVSPYYFANEASDLFPPYIWPINSGAYDIEWADAP